MLERLEWRSYVGVGGGIWELQDKIERNTYGSRENYDNYKRGALMKSKTLVFATLLLATAFLLMQAIALKSGRGEMK